MREPIPVVLAVVLAGLLACGSSDPPVPPPATVSAGSVTIETDPLRLIVRGPAGELVVDHFVEIGTVEAVDPDRYYDPRDTLATVAWSAAQRAVAWDEASETLTLDTGVRLRLVAGPIEGAGTVELDASTVDGAVLVRLVLPRDPAEPIYGFGESFVSAEAGGSVREMQLRVEPQSESSLNEVHAPVPLSLWPARGIGAFVEDPRPGAFDVGAARPERVLATYTLAQPGPLRTHLFTAAEPLGLVRRYVDLTARPALPPMWAFAPQQWRNAHESSQEVRDDAEAMRALGIPGSVMWIDNPWQTAYNDFTFDENRFENPEQLLADLKALGYRVVVWSTPYVNRDGPTAGDFAEARAAGYLVTDGSQPLVLPWQDGPGALVDFTAPGATEWWRERIARITALGVSGFKLDFGEDIVPELGGNIPPFSLHAGTAHAMHNQYTYHYHEAYYGALPPGDGFLITRAGAYGDQAVNTAIWPGDLDSDFSRHGVDNGQGKINVGGLPAAVAAGLSLSVSGYPFFGSDIGGFREGRPSTETLIRWAQYAALGTIMQLGGGGKSHNPWDTELYDPPALEVYQVYARLHMDLVPYLYTLAVTAASDGTPVTRPTRFVHPEAHSDDATFLLGDALFVAPVIEEGARRREVVLPAGRWVHWWSGAVTTADGVTPITVDAPLEELPLWRRAGAFVPLFARPADTLEPATAAGVTSYADPALGRELRLVLTPDSPKTGFLLYDGASVVAGADGDDYRLTAAAGDQFDRFTFDLDVAGSELAIFAAPGAITADGVALPEAASLAEADTCASPGCRYLDEASGLLRVRVAVPPGGTTAIRIAAP